MHIPDGFLNIEVSVLMYILTGIFLLLAFAKAKKVAGEKHVPLLAVLAAAIFAGQMINFPLVAFGGTSGHLLGAALAVILLGPYSGLIIMALVLVVQALIFADGGITVLGANIFNMGIAGCFAAYICYKLLKKTKLAIFLASWLSVVAAAVCCTLQLAISGTVPLEKAMLAMIPIHAVIGIGEALITIGIISFIEKTRPDMLKLEKISPWWIK